MREDSLVLVASRPEHHSVPSPFSKTSAESLWDTIKNTELHILLREPALMELARRREPGILSFCETLVNCGDQECWFTGIKALAALGTYEAVQRLNRGNRFDLCAERGIQKSCQAFRRSWHIGCDRLDSNRPANLTVCM
jgi:hypothetical protein